MFYEWLYAFSDSLPSLNVFKYITVRAFLSFFMSFGVFYFLAPFFIAKLKQNKLRQKIRDDWAQESAPSKKQAVTMGGVLIILSSLVAALFWVDITNPLVLCSIGVCISFGLVGFWDDRLKVLSQSTRGLSMRARLLIEFGIGICALGALYYAGALPTGISLPFFKHSHIPLGGFYILWGAFVIVASANAVNMTDGLDGLAVVPVMVCISTLMVFAYVAGHFNIAQYLYIPFVAGAGELVPLGAGVVAACMGFLWFNAYPATVFMGDVGSLSLGSFIGISALLSRQELLLVVLGGVFVVEAGSSLVQILHFKLTRQRILPVAPLHHYFEMQGVSENKIVVRFWIISVLLAVLSLSALKLR